ncbi:unnamed protein product [Symbiodinium sp. CCMP2592]|nr:unnamed protein product [Symbiodinium sp. CCMP2592]
MGRMNAGLSGPLAFDPDTSSAYDALQPQPSTQDFSQEPTEEPTVQSLAERLRALDLWKLASVFWKPTDVAPSKPCGTIAVEPVNSHVFDAFFRPGVAGLLLTLQQAFPTIAVYFTEAAVDACQYQGPSAWLDSEGDPEAKIPPCYPCSGPAFFRTHVCTCLTLQSFFLRATMQSLRAFSFTAPMGASASSSAMASDHDAFSDWLKTLAPEELAKLKALHSASAQTAADTAVQDDARPCDSSSSLSPRSLLVYQNQEAFYHAQDGCYTGPIPACFDYVPPQDVADLDDADTAQPSQAEPAQPSQPSVPAADAEAAAVTEQPIEAEGECLPMKEPSSSTAFHAIPQAGLHSMMGQLIDVTSVVTAATHQQPFPLLFFDPEAQSKPINRHELWQPIKRPDLATPPPAQQPSCPDSAKAPSPDPLTKAMPQVQQSPPPKPKAAEPETTQPPTTSPPQAPSSSQAQPMPTATTAVPFCPYHSACGRELNEGDRGSRLLSAKGDSTNRRDLDPAGGPTQITRKGQEASRKAKALEQWKELLWLLGQSADLYRSLQEAKYSQQLLAQSIMPCTAGTLETYLSACRQFIEYLILNSLAVSTVSVASLGDLLWACHSSLEEDREVCRTGPKPMIKALSWLAKTAGLAQLAAVLSDRLIRSFTAQADTDRREALPLPLAVVTAWERRICQPECPIELCLLLGGFLLALHGGLRFGDLQCMAHENDQAGLDQSPGEDSTRQWSRLFQLARSSACTKRCAIPARDPCSHQPPPTTPADDIEALLVESFAVTQADSSDSEDLATPPTVEDIALFQNGPWGSVHAQPLGADKAACGLPASVALFEQSELAAFLQAQGAPHAYVTRATPTSALSTFPKKIPSSCLTSSFKQFGPGRLLSARQSTIGGLFLCPEPDSDRVLLATAPLPTWPCADPGLAALEAAGMFAAMPLSTKPAQRPTLASALQCHEELAKDRAPKGDGAGNASSADWSRPKPSIAAMEDIMQAWLTWASQRDLPKRVFAHLSQSKPDHPIPEEDQLELIRIACEVMEWDYDSMAQAAEGQPFRLNLLQAFADLLDPDKDLPAMLRVGVHTGVFDPIEPSGLWPLAKIQPLASSGLEVCEGNWKPAEADPDTVRSLLAEEEAARIIEVSSRPVHCKADLPPQPKSSGIEAIPTTSLSLPPLVACLARADAMAEGDRHGLVCQAWTMDEVRPFLTKDAHKYIACFETLAQLALAMTARERHAFSQFSVCLPSQSDNTPSEAGINKLFTTSWPLSQFLQLIASWSSCHGVDLQVSHVAGAHNQWADDVSRGRLQAFSHRPQERVRISFHRLASAASQATWSASPPTPSPPPPPAVGDTCLLPYRLDLSLKWGSLCLG